MQIMLGQVGIHPDGNGKSVQFVCPNVGVDGFAITADLDVNVRRPIGGRAAGGREGGKEGRREECVLRRGYDQNLEFAARLLFQL